MRVARRAASVMLMRAQRMPRLLREHARVMLMRAALLRSGEAPCQLRIRLPLRQFYFRCRHYFRPPFSLRRALTPYDVC
jgi:hypothetical protein